MVTPVPVHRTLPRIAVLAAGRRWWEALQVAVDAILSHRLRSSLTIIGIVIGVAVAALVAALLEGAQTFITKQTAGLGPGIVRVDKAAFQDFIGDGQAFADAKAKRPDITTNHLNALRERLADQLEVGAQVDAAVAVRYGNRSLKAAALQGVTPNIGALSVYKIERGRELTEFDEENRREVCVIGADTADYLFPVELPIGKQIRLGAYLFEVVGVYAPQGSSFGASQDSFVQVPLSSWAKVFGARSRSIALLAKARQGVNIEGEALEDLVRFHMRQVRRLQPGEQENFSVTTDKKVSAFAGQITTIVAAVLFPLTAIALVVGGIVVINMMLASDTERTREIGIRMAIGARRSDILAQFLLESTLLTFIGGGIGILFAAAIAWLFGKVSGIPIGLPTWAIVAALSVSCTVGIAFGVFPARKAARLDPIEALRTE
ncbi:MAG: ABC transporter permease [Blastocatellia bacterium]